MAKGKQLANLAGITEDQFKFSYGWIQCFKVRNNIKRYKFHGEASSVDQNILAIQKPKLIEILSSYELKNIYNFDECGLIVH